ncbi:MAG: MlaD family protein [Nitrospirota bacterium]
MFEIKKQLMWSKLRVGLVITIALLIIFLTIFFAGNIAEILSPKSELKVQIQDVGGLRRGAPVWVSGIEVGSVKSITLNPVCGTVVTLSVDRKALEFLRKDSEATIMTMGLLGDKYVELSNGTPQAEPIKPGDMIKGINQIELQDVMETSAASIKKMSEFIGKLEGIVEKIESGKGTVSKFLTDPEIYNNLKETTKTLSVIIKDLKTGQGTIKMLIEDPSLYNKMLAAASSMEELSRTINTSSGTIRKLVEDPTLYNKMLAASLSIEEFSKKLTQGDGTLKRLAEDPDLYENLNSASKRLSSILEKIDAGEGVAGSMIKDEELAIELRETIRELKKLTGDIKEHPRKYFRFSIF